MKITPETLTRELVESLLDWAHPNGEGLDPNHTPDRRLAADIRTWLRWEAAGRGDPPPHPASRSIAAALEHRATGGS